MLVRGQRYNIYCSGVVVGPRMIATAAHCVDNFWPGEPIYYVTHEGYRWGWRRHVAVLLAADAMRDVALLRPTQAFPDWAEMRLDTVYEGEPVCSSFHPRGNPYRFDCGTVLMHARPIPTVDLLEYHVTIPIAPGASGAGLWDRDGKYCGTAVRYHHLTTGWGIYVSAGPMAQLMGIVEELE